MFDFLKHTVPQKRQPRKSPEELAREEKDLRENLTESEIDKILKDTFPASDPPAWH